MKSESVLRVLLLVTLLALVAAPASATSIDLTATTNVGGQDLCSQSASGSGFQSVACHSVGSSSFNAFASGQGDAFSGRLDVSGTDSIAVHAQATLSLLGNYFFAGTGTQSFNIGGGGGFLTSNATLRSIVVTLDGVSYNIPFAAGGLGAVLVDVALGQVHTVDIEASITFGQDGSFTYDISRLGAGVTPVPEPASLLLLLSGVSGLLAGRGTKRAFRTWKNRIHCR